MVSVRYVILSPGWLCTFMRSIAGFGVWFRSPCMAVSPGSFFVLQKFLNVSAWYFRLSVMYFCIIFFAFVFGVGAYTVMRQRYPLLLPLLNHAVSILPFGSA